MDENVISKEVDINDEPVDNACKDILADLTPCDVRVLVRAEEELSQCQTFQRLFPTSRTGRYLQVLLPPPPVMLMAASTWSTATSTC